MTMKNFEAFYKKYTQARTEELQYALLKDFTLSLSLDELLAWNDFIGEKLSKGIKESIEKGLTEEDHVWFKQQFAKFDTLEATLKNPTEHRQAA
jgi:hypothetical protein